MTLVQGSYVDINGYLRRREHVHSRVYIGMILAVVSIGESFQSSPI